jgi:quercetin dioxygenase-like cupin family protein
MKILLYALVLSLLVCTAQARDSNGIHTDTLARATTSWNGAALPAYPQGTPEITILKYTIPPHTALPWHEHPYINAGVLLSGTLTVESQDGQTLHLAAGDSLIELVNTWHHGINDGDEPAVILVFYAGIEDTPVTVKKP